MNKFVINANFNGKISPIVICLGQANYKEGMLHFQTQWLAKECGGKISSKALSLLEELRIMSVKNNVEFANLCVIALAASNQFNKYNDAENW